MRRRLRSRTRCRSTRRAQLIRRFLAAGDHRRARPHPRSARSRAGRRHRSRRSTCRATTTRRWTAGPCDSPISMRCGRHDAAPHRRVVRGQALSRHRRRRRGRADLHRWRDAAWQRHGRDAGTRDGNAGRRDRRAERRQPGGTEPAHCRRRPEARRDRCSAPGSACARPSSACSRRSASANATVYRKLRVAFFSTGDELRSIGQPLAAGEIYDSNRYTLYGMLTRLELRRRRHGRRPRRAEAARARVRERRGDRGRRHHVAAASRSAKPISSSDLLDKLGEVLFWKIAMKPGRPLAYGKIGGAHFFGLPGNPGVGDGDVLRVRARRAARSAGTARRAAVADVQGDAGTPIRKRRRDAPSSSAAS